MKNKHKGFICFLLTAILCIAMPINVMATKGEKMDVVGGLSDIVVSIDSKTDLVMDVDIRQSKSGNYAIANAHGWFTYAGTNERISSYGLDVSFAINGQTSSVSHGGYINTYHNTYQDNYKALNSSRISGEDTSSCAAKGTYTLVYNGQRGDPVSITLTLVIKSDGSKVMKVNGNYDQWDVVWE